VAIHIYESSQKVSFSRKGDTALQNVAAGTHGKALLRSVEDLLHILFGNTAALHLTGKPNELFDHLCSLDGAVLVPADGLH
jgi:hypothetical protein